MILSVEYTHLTERMRGSRQLLVKKAFLPDTYLIIFNANFSSGVWQAPMDCALAGDGKSDDFDWLHTAGGSALAGLFTGRSEDLPVEDIQPTLRRD